MGLVEGTNCGFVLTPPTTDPAESGLVIDSYTVGCKFTAPADIAKVIKMGWYCGDNPDEAPNFELGIYTHDAGNDRPGVLIAKTPAIQLTNGVGWKVSAALNINLTPNIIYWLALQVDDTSSNTDIDLLVTEAYIRDFKGPGETELEDPWGVSDGKSGRLEAVYAHYTTGLPAFPVSRLRKGLLSGYHVFMNQYIKAKEEGLLPLKKPDGTTF